MQLHQGLALVVNLLIPAESVIADSCCSVKLCSVTQNIILNSGQELKRPQNVRLNFVSKIMHKCVE